MRGIDATLRSYASLLFSSSRLTGLLLVIATALEPNRLLCALVALGVAALAARLLQLEAGAVGTGPYGYNALLVGLGVAHLFGAGPAALAIVVVASTLSVILAASLGTLFARTVALPVLSLPFVLVLWLVGNLGPYLGVPTSLSQDVSFVTVERTQLSVMIESLGGIVFAPRVDVGLVVLLALIVHSRIAVLLAATACAVLCPWIAPLCTLHGGLVHPFLFNGILTAMAMGGVWFIPSTSSFVLAAAGALLTAILSVGLSRPLAALGLPLAILPFNLGTFVMLCAMRQRSHDQCPQSVDFIPGTPEQNLLYARTRTIRLLQPRGVRFRLPFRGSWICTQGVDGPVTHQGIWRHGFDFEVEDGGGRLSAGNASNVEDYHCYRLPVLAPADGTVVRVDNDVPDNAVGGMELERNWGNLVMIHHAPGVYSLVAHLARGSANVHQGQVVRAGDVVGLCGNSGRSPKPHLHFQLQSTHLLGAATRPCQFEDIVVVSHDGDEMQRLFTPKVGDVVRNPAPDRDVAGYFAFREGDTVAFRTGKAVERIVAETNLLGQRVLRSVDGAGILYYSRSDEDFTVLDIVGPQASVLQILRIALSRVPFDGTPSLRWRDYLPGGLGRSRLGNILSDFVAPFSSSGGLEMEYALCREQGALVLQGVSIRRDRRGVPLLRTKAELLPGALPLSVRVDVRTRTIMAHRDITKGAPTTAGMGALGAAPPVSSSVDGQHGAVSLGERSRAKRDMHHDKGKALDEWVSS